MVGTKGGRTTPREAIKAVTDFRVSRNRSCRSPYASDNTINRFGRSSKEDRKVGQPNDSCTQDSRQAKTLSGRGLSRTPRDKDRTSPSPRGGIFGSAPVDGKMHKKMILSRRKGNGNQTMELSSRKEGPSTNKDCLTASPTCSRCTPITPRGRAKSSTPSATERSKQDPRSSPISQSRNVRNRALLYKSHEQHSVSSSDFQRNKMADSVVLPSNEKAIRHTLAVTKVVGTKSAGVSAETRRGPKSQHVNKAAPQVSPFSVMANAPILDKPHDSPRISSKITFTEAMSPKSQVSQESLTFWSRMHSVRSGDIVPPTPQFHRDKSRNKRTMDLQRSLSSDRSKSPTMVESRLSKLRNEEDRESYDSMLKILDGTWGKSIARKKSKNSTGLSPRSTEESDACSSTTKKSHGLPKIVRSLGKALSKRWHLADDTKTRNLKQSLKNALASRKSKASEENSDSCSSLDIDEIQVINPELYATILETVASWCEKPVAEPEAESDALSARTFSSISFRKKGSRDNSQDLSNFSVEGISAEETTGSVVATRETEDSQGEYKNGLESTDTLCPNENDSNSLLGAASDVSTTTRRRNSQQVQSRTSSTTESTQSRHPLSLFELADSDSDDEDELSLATHRRTSNSFLHLTSSELEPFEVKGAKEILKMQGIWFFDWDKCSTMQHLSSDWKQSACLQKYLKGGRGIEISMEDRIVKCFLYPSKDYECPLERVYLDDVPKASDNNKTSNIKGTLTSMGLRTTCIFDADKSKREELFCLEKDGLCVQVSTELANGETNVSRVFLKRAT